MIQRTILIGYGVNARVALASLRMDCLRPGLTVVDIDGARVVQAAEDGARALLGDGCHLGTLLQAGVEHAQQIIVAVGNDALALRITAALRCANEDATLVAVISEPQLCEMVVHLGADHVIVTPQVVEPAPEIGEDAPLAVAERSVDTDEVGRPPVFCQPTVLALVRDGRRMWLEDPEAGCLREGDKVLEVLPATGEA
ncbi:NAD(P)-binding protein [Lentzea sp. E54]|uniref:NAD(P)-binding protein n=1 Tax=Lentzea xerophila TaxID=3435883 RepID=UPI003DA40E0C